MHEKLLSITQRLRLPSICILCKQFHAGKFAVCSFCEDLIPPLGQCCQHCAYPLPDTTHLQCGACIKKLPYFDKTFAASPFEEPLRSLIHRFKYRKNLYIGKFISHLMWEAFPKTEPKPQCLIPVPIHRKRMHQRGFNQSAVLAKLLAKQLRIPCDVSACKKIIHTDSQADLNGEQREKNLRKAFETKPLPYQHAVLVDDLITTGSTANEVAYMLKKSGVKTVTVWCCARTVSLSKAKKVMPKGFYVF